MKNAQEWLKMSILMGEKELKGDKMEKIVHGEEKMSLL